MTHTPARQPKGVPTGGQFAATAHAEATVGLDATPATDTPVHRRSISVLREDQEFLDAMEAAEDDVRARDVHKGDWVRLYGDDEYGVVKYVGVSTLTTDAWREPDTDGGDLVVAVVRKEAAEALLAEHGALPPRAVTAYTKRRAAALDVANRWDATSPGEVAERRSIGYYELCKAARGVWRSMVDAGIATEPEHDLVPSRHSAPEAQALERDYYAYNSLLTFGGHSDTAADRLVQSMRAAVTAADRHFVA